MKQKIKHWLTRYLPPELAGTLSVVIFPTIAALFTSNILLIALAGTWGENVGFYGTIIIRDTLHDHKKYAKQKRHYGKIAFIKTVRNIFIEFGVAEVIDSFFVRPAIMFFTISFFPNLQVGILTGKVTADVLFYIPTIISFELRKKYLKD